MEKLNYISNITPAFLLGNPNKNARFKLKAKQKY